MLYVPNIQRKKMSKTLSSTHKPSKDDILIDYIKSTQSYKKLKADLPDEINHKMLSQCVGVGFDFYIYKAQPKRKVVKTGVGKWSLSEGMDMRDEFKAREKQARIDKKRKEEAKKRQQIRIVKNPDGSFSHE